MQLQVIEAEFEIYCFWCGFWLTLFKLQAGMTKTKDSDQLLIALEPEAASVYCRSLGLNHFIGEFGNDAKPKFKTGTRYLVIDAGG